MEEERLQKIESELAEIRARNTRVTSDKAWETSWTRTFSVALVTYVCAAILLYMINTANYLLGALVPTLGYILSTQSLPVVKNWWIKNC